MCEHFTAAATVATAAVAAAAVEAPLTSD